MYVSLRVTVLLHITAAQHHLLRYVACMWQEAVARTTELRYESAAAMSSCRAVHRSFDTHVQPSGALWRLWVNVAYVLTGCDEGSKRRWPW